MAVWSVLTKSFKKWPLFLYLNLQRASFRYAFGLRRLYKSFMRINTHTHALGFNTNSLRVKMAAKFGLIQTVYINLEYKYLMLLPLRRVSTPLWTTMRKRNDQAGRLQVVMLQYPQPKRHLRQMHLHPRIRRVADALRPRSIVSFQLQQTFQKSSHTAPEGLANHSCRLWRTSSNPIVYADNQPPFPCLNKQTNKQQTRYATSFARAELTKKVSSSVRPSKARRFYDTFYRVYSVPSACVCVCVCADYFPIIGPRYCHPSTAGRQTLARP